MRPGRRRAPGFTLIEAMVAITILSIVTALIWGGFSQTARNKAQLEAALDRQHGVQATLERMSRELSMAFVSAQLNKNEGLQVVRSAFVGERDRVDFTSFSHQRLRRDAHESDQNELSYFVAHDPNEPGQRVIARREQKRIDDDATTGGRVQILLENVESLELEYLDPSSGEWLDTWDTTQAAMQPNRLPSQVRILVTVPDPRGRGKKTFGTRASIQVVWGLNHAVYM